MCYQTYKEESLVQQFSTPHVESIVAIAKRYYPFYAHERQEQVRLKQRATQPSVIVRKFSGCQSDSQICLHCIRVVDREGKV